MIGTLLTWLSAGLLVGLLVIAARLAVVLWRHTRYESDAESHATLGLSSAGAKTPAFESSWPE